MDKREKKIKFSLMCSQIFSSICLFVQDFTHMHIYYTTEEIHLSKIPYHFSNRFKEIILF